MQSGKFINNVAFTFSVFKTDQSVSGTRKHYDSIKPDTPPNTIFFFLQSVRSKLCASLMMVFAWKSPILHWALHNPFNPFFKVSQGACSHSFKNYGFVCDSVFISTCNDHLATITKITVLEYNEYAWDQRTTVVLCCQLKRHLKGLRLAPTSLSMHNNIIWTSHFLFSRTPGLSPGWS